MTRNYEVGQSWSYKTLPGFENSRILIGAIEEEIPEIGEVICISLTHAPMPSTASSVAEMATIPFIPFARDAIDQSVIKLDGDDTLPENFEDLRADWKSETDGEDFLPVSVPVFLDMLVSGTRA